MIGRFFHTARGKIAALSVFTLVVIGFLVYLFDTAGMRVPLISSAPYTISFNSANVGNLVPLGDVRLAGVQVGKIRDVTRQNGSVRVDMDLDSSVKPLHQGLSVRVGTKTAIGESYADLTDGTGPPLPSGTFIPDSAVKPPVTLGDVLQSLDPQTRQALGGLVRNLGVGTDGSAQDLSNALTGLGNLGREGYTALDAISAQTDSLKTLAQQTNSVLSALNTGEGQVGTLVQNAQTLTSATSGQADSLSQTVRDLPGVLSSAQTATGKVSELANSLAPVAADLKSSAPYLNTALQQLPPTTADLRGLLPSLNGTLNEAPDTLNRVPALSNDVNGIVPQLRTTLSNLDPILAFLRPYGPDLAAFFENFNAILNYTDEAGIHYINLQPTVNELDYKGVPLKLPGILTYQNPYPSPGGSVHTDGPTGTFTRLYPEPK